jgi:flagellar hook-associated protein 2
VITASGLGSGLDINSLVSQLVQTERAPFDLSISRERQRIEPRISALGEFKAAAANVQQAISPLKLATNYDRKLAESSNTSALRATASSVAVAGSYQVNVERLASTQSLASSGFTATDDVVGTGSLELRFGTTDYSGGVYNGFTNNPERNPVSIQIDSTNNTLAGIMNSINAADAGVRATIVNDGSGFRLLLASEITGAANSMEISIAGDGDGNDTDNAGLSRLSFSSGAANLQQTQAAQDLRFSLNGLTIENPNNQLASAIPGVTLTFQEETSSPFTLSVRRDTDIIVNAARGFVAAYNEFRTKVAETSGYDQATKIAGPLISDFTTRSVVRDIEGILRGNLSQLGAGFNNLAEFGITTDRSGVLQLDEQRFTDILINQPDKMSRLYEQSITASDPEITVLQTGPLTRTGTYPVVINSLATLGGYEGAGVLPDFTMGGTVNINGSNDDFELRVNGVTANINLAFGNYTSGTALASMIESTINSNAALQNANLQVAVSYEATTNNLNLQVVGGPSGSGSRIDIVSANSQAGTTLGLNIGNGTAGSDISGTINGLPGIGAGNTLTAASGNPASGIVLQVDGSTTGTRGTVTFAQSIWPTLDRYLNTALGEEGAVTRRIAGFEQFRIDLDERALKLEERWEQAEIRYRNQFNALDRLVAQLRSTGSFLETQLASLNAGRG